MTSAHSTHRRCLPPQRRTRRSLLLVAPPEPEPLSENDMRLIMRAIVGLPLETTGYIYAIICLETGRRYIGSTESRGSIEFSLSNRLKEHEENFRADPTSNYASFEILKRLQINLFNVGLKCYQMQYNLRQEEE